MSLLFLLLIIQFLFFALGGGQCVQGAMLLWPGLSVGVPQYHKAHLVHVFLSSLGMGNWQAGALLVSPFNMKWRFSVPAGGVEGSKFCPFLVILLAKWFSSVSTRFHYRSLAFCFLPLATILESSPQLIF
jgi:hypothetical protein